MHNIHHNLGTRALKYYRGVNAVILWLAFFTEIIWFAVFVFVVKIIPAIFSGKFDFPMLFFKKIIKKKSDELYINAPSLRFAQSLASLFLLTGFTLFYFDKAGIGWFFVGLTALMCTVGASGFCFCSIFYAFFKRAFPRLTKEVECQKCNLNEKT